MDCGHLNLDVGLYQATLSACTPLSEGRDRCVDDCPSPALPSTSPHSATQCVALGQSGCCKQGQSWGKLSNVKSLVLKPLPSPGFLWYFMGMIKSHPTLLNAPTIRFIQRPVCVWKYSSSLFILCHKNDIFEEIIMNKVANLAGRFTRKVLRKK